MAQVIDPSVSKQKFEEELQKFKSSTHLRKMGVLLVEANYPDIVLNFFAAQVNPVVLRFTAVFNFENYDLEPISIRFINIFTGEPNNQPIGLFYKNEQGQPGDFWQKHDGQAAFVCMPGVREYHHHPFHTGDDWLSHRGKGGEGTLGYLIEKLYQTGIVPYDQFQFNVNIQMLGLQANATKIS